MSFKILNWAWQVSAPSPTSKLVLVSLADQSNDAGICWPAVNSIADRTGLSRRAVIDNVHLLGERGYITIIRRGGDGEGRKSNVYQLHHEKGLSAFAARGGKVQELHQLSADDAGLSAGAAPKPSYNHQENHSAPNGAGANAPLTDEEKKTALYAEVKAKVGKGAGGMVTKLIDEQGSISRAWDAWTLAKNSTNPTDYLGAILGKLQLPKDNTTLWAVRKAAGLPVQYDDIEACHAEITAAAQVPAVRQAIKEVLR